MKIKYMLGAVLICLSLTSCGDFLEIEPKTFVSEDNFWNEKTDIDQMMTGVYVKMQSDPFIRRCIMWGETRSDNVIAGRLEYNKQVDEYRTLRNQLMSTNQYTDWSSFYAVIAQCNIIIARASEVAEKDPTYMDSDVRATQAEATFLRALSYFYLVRAFKDVPYYTKAIQSDDDIPELPAVSGDVIVRELIADLESVAGNALKAYPEDNDSRFNSDCNRVTQNAIYALLADLCLWDKQYQKCVDYAQKVIDAKCVEYREDPKKKWKGSMSSMSDVTPTLIKWNRYTDPDATHESRMGYPLYPCYTQNSDYYGHDFNTIFSATGNSFESIFELAFTYSESSNYLLNIPLAQLYGNLYSGDMKINNATQYSGNDGMGWLAVYDDVVADLNSTPKVFVNDHDCRYYTNIYTGDASGSATSGYVAKYVYSRRQIYDKADISGATTTLPFATTPNYNSYPLYATFNWIFYRLSDVMLMQAEALIELATHDEYIAMTTDDSGNRVPLTDENGSQVYDENLIRAFSIIYAVNRRSIMDRKTLITNPTAYDLDWTRYQNRALLRDLCREERRRELMFEGKRWFDLIRYCRQDGSTKYLQSKVPAKSGGSVPVSFEALYWPYNKNEVKNNPNLSQKAYYGDDDTDGNFESTK